MFAVADFNSLSAGFSYGQPIHPLQPPFHKIPENIGGDVIRHLYNQEWPVICVGPPSPAVDGRRGHADCGYGPPAC